MTPTIRIYTQDYFGNECSRLIMSLSELDAYNGTKTKVAISPAVFDGKGMKSCNVVTLTGIAIDLDAVTQSGFLSLEQARTILTRIPSSFAPFARVVYSNGVTIWLDFVSPCATSIWPDLVRGLFRLATEVTAGLPWVEFDRGTIVKNDGAPAQRYNAVFRYHPSWADRRGATTEQLSDGGPMDAQLLIDYGAGYMIPTVTVTKAEKSKSPTSVVAGAHRGSLKSQESFISAVTHYIQTSCDQTTLVARYGITRKEADKIIGFRAALDRRLARKVLLHHRTTLPLLPQTPINDLKPFTKSQRYAQKTFDAIAFLGWYYFYLREAGLTVEQGWQRLLHDDNLAPLKKIVIRHWTLDQWKADYAVWKAIYGSRGLPPISAKLTATAHKILTRDPKVSVRKLAKTLGVSGTHAHRVKRAWVA